MNPWLSIWIKPQKTTIQQLDSPRWTVFLLVALFGLTFQLDQAASGDFGSKYSTTTLLLLTPIMGILVGFIYWYVMSGLSHWSAKFLLGGHGDWQETKVAFAWAGIPFIAKLLFWIPQILLFGKEAFSDVTPTIDGSTTLSVLFFIFELLGLALTIWYYITLANSVAAVHQFSWIKGLGAILLSLAIVVGTLMVISLVVAQVLLNA